MRNNRLTGFRTTPVPEHSSIGQVYPLAQRGSLSNKMVVHLPNEEHLVRCLQDDQANSFATLYDAFSPTLYGTLLRMMADPDLAADLLQDSFVKIWSSRKDYSSQQGRLFTWLINITRRVAIDELRAQKVRSRASAFLQKSADRADNPLAVDGRLNTSLTSQLEPNYRVIVEMHYEGDYTLPEVAGQLKLPLGTVKTRHRKAIQLLKTFFHQDIQHYQFG